MIIRLFQPPTKNWLLLAEDLDDPAAWDRFLPCHSADSQRRKFEVMVKETAKTIKIKSCKELLKRGTSVFEYDWDTNEDVILAHAMEVAENFGLELLMEAPTAAGAGRQTSAA
jgi:hypothetical protein